MCTEAEPREEENGFQEPLKHRAEILAVLGTGTCCIGRNSHQPPSTLSYFSLPQSASSTILKPVWVLMPFTVKHHQPPAEHHQCVFLSMSSPIMKNVAFPQPPSTLSTIHLYFCLEHLSRYIQHPVCAVCPLLFIPTSQLPRHFALLYLIPTEPINSEHPAFSWAHSLFNNTTPYFK